MTTKKNLSLTSLTLIITTTVFSFSSMSTAFFLMGTKSLPWFFISAFCYFIPYALIISEYTRKYSKSSGGIYDWLKEAFSPRIAFITAFLWYCSYFTWIISLFMKLSIPLSILIFGQDLTAKESWFSIPTQVIIMIVSIGILFGITYLISKGFQTVLSFLKISSFSMLGLILISSLSLFILIGNQSNTFVPNLIDSFQTPVFFQDSGNHFFSQLPFFLFSITAFGGLDTIASLADKTGKQRKKFPKALIFSSILITCLYFGGIILWSGGTNLTELRQTNQLHLGNLMYGLMGSLAKQLAVTLHLSTNQASLLYQFFIRYTAFTLFISYLGLLSSITYAPLKSLIQGTPKAIWPKKLTRLNQQQMPSYALWIQSVIVAVCIVFLSLNSTLVENLFNQLTYMTNVSRAIPYFIVAASYPFFYKKNILPASQRIVSKKWLNLLLSFSVCFSISISIIFQVYFPYQSGNYLDTISILAGPIFFGCFGGILYRHFEQRNSLELL